MKKFFRKLWSKTQKTFKRRPLLVALIIISTLLSMILVYRTDTDYKSTEYGITKVLLAIHLILPIAISLVLSKKYLQKKPWMYPTIISITIVSLFLYVFSIFPLSFEDSKNITKTGALAYQYIVPLILSILSIFLVPYIYKLRQSDESEFLNKSMWGHVQQIFNGFAAAIIFGLATQIGLSLALGALETLWDLNIEYWAYGIIGVFAYNFVGYMRLISNIETVDKVAQNINLNKVVAGFAKFILLPLTVIYTVILYPYILKVVFTGDWVPNMITALTLVFLLLTYSIVYILFFDKSIKIFKIRLAKLLPALAIPVILIQMYGFWIRIDAYGFTVNRAELLMFAVFSLILSSYFVLSKKPKLIAIPLLFVAYLVIATPLSFVLGKNSQLTKHLELMESYDLVDDEKVISSKIELTLDYDKVNEIEESFEYLLGYHGLEATETILDKEIYKEIKHSDDKSNYELASLYVEKLNIESKYNYYNNYYNEENYLNHNYYSLDKNRVDTNTLDLEINSIEAIQCYKDCNIEVEVFNNGWEITMDGETYDVSEDQVDLLLGKGDYYENNNIILLRNIYNDSHLLIFSLDTYETENTNENEYPNYKLEDMTAWRIK